MKYTVVLTAEYPAIAREILAGQFDVIEHPTEQARSEEEMIQLLERVSSLGLSREDLRRRAPKATAGARRKPFVFSFKSPDKSYRLNLSFRRSSVDRQDLITALQEILQKLVEEQQAEN